MKIVIANCQKSNKKSILYCNLSKILLLNRKQYFLKEYYWCGSNNYYIFNTYINLPSFGNNNKCKKNLKERQ